MSLRALRGVADGQPPLRLVLAGIAVAALLAVAILAGTVLLWDRASDNPTPPMTQQADVPGSGGGGPARPDTVAAHQSLPVYPGAAALQEPVATGARSSVAFYMAAGEPEAIMSFYGRELAAKGWRPAGEPVIERGAKMDGSEAMVISRLFTKDGNELRIEIAPSTKDTARGNAQITVRLLRAE